MGQCHIENDGILGAPTGAPLNVGSHWITSTGDHYLSVGTASVADWILVTGTPVITANLPDATPVVVDTILMANLCTVKYVVCVFSAAQNKWRSFEMLGGKVTSTTVEDSLYSSLGSILNVDFDFDVSGSNAELTVTNNEAFAVDIKISKSLI